MNMAHLSRARTTVFERLDDAGVRTACTTYLIYRGRTRHELAGEGVYAAHRARRPVPPRRLRARASSSTPTCSPRARPAAAARSGMPGQRDQHTGCVGAYLVEHDLFDFMLFSLPDNDTYSHKRGPDAQVALDRGGRPRARADHARRPAAPDAFLDEHAVIVMSDHSQTTVEDRASTWPTRFADAARAQPTDAGPTEARARASARPRARPWSTCSTRAAATSWWRGAVGDPARARGRRPRGDAATAARRVVRSAARRAALRPGRRLADLRGGAGASRATLAALGSTLRRTVRAPSTPTRSAGSGPRWSCPHSGDVLASAQPGYEFVDWGGADHVGGGSHGSLHRGDSEGVLLLCGTGARPAREQWTIRTSPRWCSTTSVYRWTDERRRCDRRRRAGRTACTSGCVPGMRKSHNWRELAKFCVGRRVRLRRQPGVFALVRRGLGVHHLIAATCAFLVAVMNNFWWNRHGPSRRRRRPRGLPGRALLGRQRGRLPVQPRILELLVSVAGVREDAGPGDRDRRGHAAELPREQAVELRASRRRGD